MTRLVHMDGSHNIHVPVRPAPTAFAEGVGPVSLLRSVLPLVGAVELLEYAPW